MNEMPKPQPSSSPEPWLRGTHTETPAVLRAVVHALELAREDVLRVCEPLSDEALFARPGGVAPIAFHLRHMVRSLDRLLTYAEGGQLKVVNSEFINNRCYSSGPDLGGAAIRAITPWSQSPVYITSDTFIGGVCSNGGALSSIAASWDVLNSVLENNEAIGWGANPAKPGTPGGGGDGDPADDG